LKCQRGDQRLHAHHRYVQAVLSFDFTHPKNNAPPVNKPKGVLLKLEWSWIDLKHGLMARRAPRTAEVKNKRTPKVRLGKRILAHLRRWHRLDGKHRRHVCHYNGQRVTKLRRSWAGAVKRAKVEATPHTLRHSRATWLMQKGVDPWKAAGHLGMTVDTLLRTYGHHHPDYQKEAAEV
jgi:integrase